jgi:hypothetical protein
MEFGIPTKLVRLTEIYMDETYNGIRVSRHLSDMFYEELVEKSHKVRNMVKFHDFGLTASSSQLGCVTEEFSGDGTSVNITTF